MGRSGTPSGEGLCVSLAAGPCYCGRGAHLFRARVCPEGEPGGKIGMHQEDWAGATGREGKSRQNTGFRIQETLPVTSL